MQKCNKGRKKQNWNCPILKTDYFWSQRLGRNILKQCVSTYRMQVCQGIAHNQWLSWQSCKAQRKEGNCFLCCHSSKVWLWLRKEELGKNHAGQCCSESIFNNPRACCFLPSHLLRKHILVLCIQRSENCKWLSQLYQTLWPAQTASTYWHPLPHWTSDIHPK